MSAHVTDTVILLKRFKDEKWKKYKLIELIGSGLTSDVYKSNSKVAIKIVNSEFETHLMDELSALLFLQHKGIPRLIGSSWCSKSERWYIGMTLAKGKDVFEWSQNSNITEKQLAFVTFQLLHIVSFAHSSNIVHRDIKLENILFEDVDKTKVLLGDWGLATTFSEDSKLNEWCGSIHYSAPEILTQIPYTGPEIDIWSIGICVYSAISKVFPFRGETSGEKMRHINNPLKFFTPVSNELKDFIASFLKCNPKKRISIANALKHPWITQFDFKSPNSEPLNRYPIDAFKHGIVPSCQSKSADSIESFRTFCTQSTKKKKRNRTSSFNF